MVTNNDSISREVAHDVSIAYMERFKDVDMTAEEYAKKYLESSREIYNVIRKATVLY